MSTLKDRVKKARRTAAAPDAGTRHDQAPDVPDTVEDLKGYEDVVPAISHQVMAWLMRYEQEFTEALPAHVDRAEFFAAVRAVLPQLARCTPASTLQALLTAARFGLIPDGTHAVIKREGKLAVFVPMYQGFIDLMYRSGAVASVHMGLVHEADEWNYEPTAPPPLDFTHRPRLDLPKKDRGPVILAYAFAWLAGGARSQVIVLTREDAEEIRDTYSEAYQRAQVEGRTDTFWHTNFDHMWAKSAMRRLMKVVPTSANLRRLADADDAGEAGRVQVLHAPDPEAAQLVHEAGEAFREAEGSQEPQPKRRLPAKRSQPRRTRRAARRSKAGAR